jgi:hypothetical protein
MLEIPDQSPTTDAPTNFLLSQQPDTAQQIENTHLDSFNNIKKSLLYCIKCTKLQKFSSNGVGGAKGLNNARPLQILCNNPLCKCKTVFHIIFDATIQHISNLSPPHPDDRFLHLEYEAYRHKIDQATKNNTKLRTPISQRQSSKSPRSSSSPAKLDRFKYNPISSAFNNANCIPSTPTHTNKRPRESPTSDASQKRPILANGSHDSHAPSAADAAVSLNERAERNQAIMANEKLVAELSETRAQMVSLRELYDRRLSAMETKHALELRNLQAQIAALSQANVDRHRSPSRSPSPIVDVDFDEEFPAISAKSATPRASQQPSRVPGHNPISAKAKGPSSSTHQSMAAVRVVPGPSGEQNNISYSKVTAKNARNPPATIKKALRNAAFACISAPKTPMEFKKLQCRLPNSLRPVPNTSTKSLIRTILRLMKIRSPALVSKIGNSVIEIIYNAEHDSDIREKLTARNISILDDVSASTPKFSDGSSGKSVEEIKHKIVNRLTSLYKEARTIRLRACVLQGHSEDIQTEVRARVPEPVRSPRSSVSLELAAAAVLGQQPTPMDIVDSDESNSAPLTPALPLLSQC